MKKHIIIWVAIIASVLIGIAIVALALGSTIFIWTLTGHNFFWWTIPHIMLTSAVAGVGFTIAVMTPAYIWDMRI